MEIELSKGEQREKKGQKMRHHIADKEGGRKDESREYIHLMVDREANIKRA